MTRVLFNERSSSMFIFLQRAISRNAPTQFLFRVGPFGHLAFGFLCFFFFFSSCDMRHELWHPIQEAF
jgi:hypothetical protein